MNVRLSQKGWVVIPADMRKKYGLKPGARLQVVDYGGVLALVPVFKNPIKQGKGILKGEDSLTRKIKEEHQQEVKRDQ